MKKSLFLLLTVFVLACQKKDIEPATNPQPVQPVAQKDIISKWELTGSGIGIGGGGVFTPADPNKPELIEFKSDGSFSANANSRYMKAYTSFKKVNTNTLNFLPLDGISDRWTYELANNGKTLRLYMTWCIELCVLEYKAVN